MLRYKRSSAKLITIVSIFSLHPFFFKCQVMFWDKTDQQTTEGKVALGNVAEAAEQGNDYAFLLLRFPNLQAGKNEWMTMDLRDITLLSQLVGNNAVWVRKLWLRCKHQLRTSFYILCFIIENIIQQIMMCVAVGRLLLEMHSGQTQLWLLFVFQVC